MATERTICRFEIQANLSNVGEDWQRLMVLDEFPRALLWFVHLSVQDVERCYRLVDLKIVLAQKISRGSVEFMCVDTNKYTSQEIAKNGK
jgi:hypothetical protein